MAAQRHLKTREEREGKKREKLIMCKSVRKSGEKKKGGCEDGDNLGKKVFSEGGKIG